MWTEDNYEKLCDLMEQTYPKMFTNKYGGFAVGPGWWKIIQLLCFNIQTYLDNKKEEPVTQVTVTQVKEKFGGLRFYYDGGDERIREMVSAAEILSLKTCEQCGNDGNQRSGSWVKTLCDVHHEERETTIRRNSYE